MAAYDGVTWDGDDNETYHVRTGRLAQLTELLKANPAIPSAATSPEAHKVAVLDFYQTMADVLAAIRRIANDP